MFTTKWLTIYHQSKFLHVKEYGIGSVSVIVTPWVCFCQPVVQFLYKRHCFPRRLSHMTPTNKLVRRRQRYFLERQYVWHWLDWSPESNIIGALEKGSVSAFQPLDMFPSPAVGFNCHNILRSQSATLVRGVGIKFVQSRLSEDISSFLSMLLWW